MYFDANGTDGKVHVRDVYLPVKQPRSADTPGLYACLQRTVHDMGIGDWKSKLVGFSSDGVSVNMAAGGLRGYLEADILWVELSPKMPPWKHTFSPKIDEMLMRVYYLLQRSLSYA